jgi:hypothetical protein
MSLLPLECRELSTVARLRPPYGARYCRASFRLVPHPHGVAGGWGRASEIRGKLHPRLGGELSLKDTWEETMIRLLISVAFAFAVATSAEATSPAPLHEPDALITQVRKARQCEDPNQVVVNGICEFDARAVPPIQAQVCGME